MSFDFDRKRTPEEIRKSLLACAETQCEQCCFYEADAPRGYSGCHDWLLHTQAAEYIWELMVLKNKENSREVYQDNCAVDYQSWRTDEDAG